MNDSILIIDDEESICRALERDLHKWAKYRGIDILFVDSAQKAYSILENKKKSVLVIISDFKMPGINGLDFLNTVTFRYPDIVSIMMTAHAEVSDIGKIVQASLFSFIQKPWTKDILVSLADKAYEFAFFKREKKIQQKILIDDLEMASEFQELFLKLKIPETEELCINVFNKNASNLHFGGDYCDIFSIGESKYFFILGDVAGHGLKASFLAGILKAVIYPEYIQKQESIYPSSFLEWLNNRMISVLKGAPDVFIAFSACLIDLKSGKAVFSNAGQPPFIHISDKKTKYSKTSEIAVGIEKEIMYPEEVINITNGDIIVMSTDGIYSSSNILQNSDFCNFIEKNLSISCNDELIKLLRGSRTAYVSDENFDDDITMVAVKIS